MNCYYMQTISTGRLLGLLGHAVGTQAVTCFACSSCVWISWRAFSSSTRSLIIRSCSWDWGRSRSLHSDIHKQKQICLYYFFQLKSNLQINKECTHLVSYNTYLVVYVDISKLIWDTDKLDRMTIYLSGGSASFLEFLVWPWQCLGQLIFFFISVQNFFFCKK